MNVRVICVMLCVFGMGDLQAQEVLGQLFSTPEQRDTLNLIREQFKSGEYRLGEINPKQQQKTVYYFQGYVKQNGKTKQVWLTKHGKTVTDLDYKNEHRGHVIFSFPKGEQSLKPGQKFDPLEGQIQEAYRVEEEEQ